MSIDNNSNEPVIYKHNDNPSAVQEKDEHDRSSKYRINDENNYDTSNNCERILNHDIVLDPKLLEQAIIKNYGFNDLQKIFYIEFNENKYPNKRIVIRTNQAANDWNGFINSTKKLLEFKGLDHQDIELLLFTCRKNYKLLSNQNSEYSNEKINKSVKVDPVDTPKYDQDQDHKNRISNNLSFEEWQSILLNKYYTLYDTIKEKLPELWKPLEFALSIKSILSIHDCTLPFIGIILGPPSSVKTLTIELFRDCNNTFYTDSFSPKSFVSHNTAVARDKLESIDLLPKIRNKFFLTPELSPIFAKRYEELLEILGIITRIADGNGYESDSGAQGHRGYTGEYMLTWLGAAVDIPQKVHNLIGTLGPKLYFLRLSNKKNISDEDYLKKIINGDRFKENFNEIKELLKDYIEWFDNCSPDVSVTEDQCDNSVTNEKSELMSVNKIRWNSDQDSRQALHCIIRLARLLSHFRAVIPTWETRDTQGSDYAYTFATIEEPERAMTQLKNLARGHALSQGRNFITMQDIPILISVVLSTASRERVTIFNHLLDNGGLTDTVRIVEALNTSKPTALKTIAQFTAIGITDKIVLGDEKNEYEDDDKYDHYRNPNLIQIKLKASFEWFLTDEFRHLRKLDSVIEKSKLYEGNYTANDLQTKIVNQVICMDKEESKLRKENCPPSEQIHDT